MSHSRSIQLAEWERHPSRVGDLEVDARDRGQDVDPPGWHTKVEDEILVEKLLLALDVDRNPQVGQAPKETLVIRSLDGDEEVDIP